MNEQTTKHKHTAKDVAATKPTHDEVEKGAYALSRNEGRPQGSADENWLEAQAQLQHAGSGHAEHAEHQEHQEHQEHENHHGHMAADFRKRFWISLILTLPILALSPMLQTLVGLGEAVKFPGDAYVLFGFSSVVFWYGGWPFLKGLVGELKSLQPGMMTLVAVAIGAGSDVAVETADVILVRSNPLDVVAIVQRSRAAYRKMIQNLVSGPQATTSWPVTELRICSNLNGV